MKKIAVLLLVLLLALVCCAWAAAEREIKSGDYRYIVLDDGTAKITNYTGRAEELVIPDELDGIKVTSIGDCAFSNCRFLTSITIPDSVTSVGDAAFANCRSLTGITIPDSVTSIGANPFAACLQLTDIIVSPDHPYLATIDGVLFSKPDKRLVCYPRAFPADSYTIPDGIQIIGNDAFYECKFLTSITIPDSVTSIGEWAFYYCYSLTSITIPDSVTSIGHNAFTVYQSYETYIPIPGLTVTVFRDSYAEQYCKDNNINYTYFQNDMGSSWTCPNCGQEGNSGNFCPNCAAPKPVTDWTCPNCGQEGNSGNFCPNCAAPRP